VARLVADLPVALNDDLSVNASETLRLAAHVRAGDVPDLLFGGNANLSAFSLAQFETVIDLAGEAARYGPVTIGIGPEFGRMLDQAPLIERSGLKNVLVLPIQAPADTHGTADGIRHIADRLGFGVIVDLIRDNHLRPATLRKLLDEGSIVAARYAVQMPNPGDDGYLDRVIEVMTRERMIGGLGEAAILDHLAVRRFGAITSGAAALVPARIRAVVQAIAISDMALARRLLTPVLELERVRAILGPIQVLHDAVTHAGIAAMGRQMPMLSPVKVKYRADMEAAVEALLASARA
jgi:dihydrodipicolinate synthase/N-acetylneuraminate lyase